MVDRPARTKALEAIDAYLGGRIWAFAFDEQMGQAAIQGARDYTVTFVSTAAWFHYDDCKDHPVNLSREQWDFFQRLRLLLVSDCEAMRARREILTGWTKWRLAIVAALIIQVWLYWHWGFDPIAVGFHLMVSVGAALGLLRQQTPSAEDLQKGRLAPFESLGALRRARRATPAFVKQRYPGGMEMAGPVRGRASYIVTSCVASLAWPVYAVFLGVFPKLKGTAQIRLSADSRIAEPQKQ